MVNQPPQVKKNGALLSKYNSGKFEEVWSEIRQYPKIGGDFREEVMEVAEATMIRVAQNADQIAEKLTDYGWIALTAQYSDLRTKPSVEDEKIFQEITEITDSRIPPTLLAFWKIVGGINWVWDYNSDETMPNLGVELPMEEMDPLCVDPPKVLPYLFEEWLDQKQQSNPNVSETFHLHLAPDAVHKANYSGGPPYTIILPFWGADPVFSYEKHELPFIDYLRLAFQWGGFPGLEDYAKRIDVQEFRKEFTKDLLPF